MTEPTAEQKSQLAEAFASIAGGRYATLQNSEFPKPKVDVAGQGDILDPTMGLAGVDVIVSYPTMLTSDIIGLSFNGDDSFETLNGSLFQKVTFRVKAAQIAAAVGKTIQIIYAVVRPAGVALSEILDLTVSSIPAQQLKPPRITEASSAGELDVSSLTEDAKVTVEPWPLIMAGQQLWLRMEGSSNLDVPAWQGYPIGDANAQTTTIPLDYLKTLADGSELKLVLEVSFDGGATRFPFPEESYTIMSAPAVGAVKIVKVTDTSGLDITDGGTTQDTTVNLLGTADTNAQLQISDGPTVVGTVTANSMGAWTYQATGLSVSTHIFTARYAGGDPTSNTWTVQVIAVPLTIDQTPMRLDGLYVRGGSTWPLTGLDAPGNTETRTARGGTPPYNYSSSRPEFVSVTSTGKAQGTGWGSSTITVTDAMSNSASYVATSSNIYELMVMLTGAATHPIAVTWMQNYNILPLTQQHVDVLALVYGNPLPPINGVPGYSWCGTANGCGSGKGLLWLYPYNILRCDPPEGRYGIRGVQRVT